MWGIWNLKPLWDFEYISLLTKFHPIDYQLHIPIAKAVQSLLPFKLDRQRVCAGIFDSFRHNLSSKGERAINSE